jgi:hypothetical protein
MKQNGKAAAAPTGKALAICKLASRPQGVSRAELTAATGWERTAWRWYLKGFCQRWKYKLSVIEGEQGERRYHIAKK